MHVLYAWQISTDIQPIRQYTGLANDRCYVQNHVCQSDLNILGLIGCTAEDYGAAVFNYLHVY